MSKPLAAAAALVVVVVLVGAAAPSGGSAAVSSGGGTAVVGRGTQVRHYVLTRVHSHRTGRFSSASADQIRDRGRVVGIARYTARRNPHRHLVRLRVRMILRHGTVRGVLTEPRRSHRVRGRIVGGSGGFRGAHGTITGRRVGHTRRTLVTLRYSRRKAPAHPPSPAASSHLTRYPYLTDVVRGNATLNFATDSSVSAAFATIGRAGGACRHTRRTGSRIGIRVAGATANQWQVRFTSLAPGTRYCYRILSGTPTAPGPVLLAKTRSSAFRTLPARRTAAFRFAVFGDWGKTNASGHNPGQAALDARIASSGALFALGTGDTAYPAGSQTNYGDLFQTGANVSDIFGPAFYKHIGDGIPLYNALGNHGLTTPFLDNWPQPTASVLSGGRSQMDTYGGVNGAASRSYPSVWYAFNAGRARIYILDAAWANSNLGSGTLYSDDAAAHWQSSSPEYRWLAADLAAHPRGLKIAVEHFPMYADSPTDGTDASLHGPGSLAALLSRNHVRLVFNGHMHAYERNTRRPGESFVSYVTGGGGAALEAVGRGGCGPYDAYAIGWSQVTGHGYSCGAASRPSSASRVYHFLMVRVRPKSVTVTPTDSTGRTFDVHTYHF